MTMKSPITKRACIDIRETARSHPSIATQMLVIHALSGCDTVAATHGIGKTTAVTSFKKGRSLDKLGVVDAYMNTVMVQATAFMVTCYGIKTHVSSMTECRQHIWGQRVGKSTIAPKLSTLPSTTEAYEMNVLRAHLQVANWYAALSGESVTLNPENYGYERDNINRIMTPRHLPPGVQYAPDSPY